MEFFTMHLGQKRSQIILKSLEKYDMFSIYPELSFIKENNTFRIDEGTKLFDFIGDQGPLKFISEKFKILIEQNNILGLDIFPIKIEKNDLMYYGYVKKKLFNSICNYDSDGDFINGSLKVDMLSWDGVTDIFSIKDSGATVCTNRAKKIIEKAKITNIEFDHLSRY